MDLGRVAWQSSQQRGHKGVTLGSCLTLRALSPGVRDIQAETSVEARGVGQGMAAVASGFSNYRGERRQPRKLGQKASMRAARSRQQTGSRLHESKFIPKAPVCSACLHRPVLTSKPLHTLLLLPAEPLRSACRSFCLITEPPALYIHPLPLPPTML